MSNRNRFIYNFLYTKIHEYIDTVVLNKNIERKLNEETLTDQTTSSGDTIQLSSSFSGRSIDEELKKIFSATKLEAWKKNADLVSKYSRSTSDQPYGFMQPNYLQRNEDNIKSNTIIRELYQLNESDEMYKRVTERQKSVTSDEKSIKALINQNMDTKNKLELFKVLNEANFKMSDLTPEGIYLKLTGNTMQQDGYTIVKQTKQGRTRDDPAEITYTFYNNKELILHSDAMEYYLEYNPEDNTGHSNETGLDKRNQRKLATKKRLIAEKKDYTERKIKKNELFLDILEDFGFLDSQMYTLESIYKLENKKFPKDIDNRTKIIVYNYRQYDTYDKILKQFNLSRYKETNFNYVTLCLLYNILILIYHQKLGLLSTYLESGGGDQLKNVNLLKKLYKNIFGTDAPAGASASGNPIILSSSTRLISTPEFTAKEAYTYDTKRLEPLRNKRDKAFYEYEVAKDELVAYEEKYRKKLLSGQLLILDRGSEEQKSSLPGYDNYTKEIKRLNKNIDEKKEIYRKAKKEFRDLQDAGITQSGEGFDRPGAYYNTGGTDRLSYVNKEEEGSAVTLYSKLTTIDSVNLKALGVGIIDNSDDEFKLLKVLLLSNTTFSSYNAVNFNTPNLSILFSTESQTGKDFIDYFKDLVINNKQFGFVVKPTLINHICDLLTKEDNNNFQKKLLAEFKRKKEYYEKKDKKETTQINKEFEYELRVDWTYQYLLDYFRNESNLDNLQRAILEETLNKENDLTYYVLQDVMQSITRNPMTTPELLNLFKDTSKAITSLILRLSDVNSSEVSSQISAPDNINRGIIEQTGIKFLYKKTAATGSDNTNDPVFNKVFTIMNEILNTNKKSPFKDSTKPSADLSQRYGITSSTEQSKIKDSKQKPYYYSITDIIGSGDMTAHDAVDFSFIMINNPLFRISGRSELELSVFLNLLSTHELSMCTPYLSMSLEIPDYLKTNSNKLIVNSMGTFLYGTKKDEDEKENGQDFYYKTISEIADAQSKSSKINVSLFSSPQTLNNFNDLSFERSEDVNFKVSGQSSKIEIGKRYERHNNVFDLTRPFLTIKSFTIDVAPTQGLMSFKTGKVSLVLHDKSRMSEIAPFVKPDLFGVIGSEIVITYGWSNAEDRYRRNVLGAFLNEQKVTEKYIITNSSFNITKNGEVNIDLSVAMRGPIDLRNTEIQKKSVNKLRAQPVTSTYGLINSIYTQLLNLRREQQSPELLTDFSFKIDAFDSVQSSITSTSINDEIPKETSDLIKNLKKVFDNKKAKELSEFQKLVASLTKKAKNRQSITTFFTDLNNLFNQYKTQTRLTAEINASAVDSALFNKFVSNMEKLGTLYRNFLKNSTSYLGSISSTQKQTKDSIEEFIQNINNVDPFYDRQLSEEIYGVSQARKINLSSYPVKGSKVRAVTQLSAKSTKGINTDFVTLGTLISGIIGTHLVNSLVYDDIQVISYCANDSAGLMSRKNLASLLIKRETINRILTDLFNDPDATLTLEGFLTQTIEETINTNSNDCYGLSDLYTIDSSGVVSPKYKDPKAQKSNIDNRLKFIYTKVIKNKEEIENAFYEFKRPKIRLTFDTLMGGQFNDKTILRISLYDENDNPFSTVSDLFIKDSDNELLKAGAELGYFKATESEKVYNSKAEDIIESLVKKDLIKIKAEKVLLGENSKSLVPIKKELKRHIPSATYGTQNSAITEASVTTVNEAKLNTVFLTRNAQQTRDKLQSLQREIGLPLNILPAQASVTMFGCPFINFAQFLYLDFESGTSIDNIYAVTGIKHDFSPGKFNTTLTLSYGDVYGKYRTALNLIEDAANTTTKPAAPPKVKAVSTSASSSPTTQTNPPTTTIGQLTPNFISDPTNKLHSANKDITDSLLADYNKKYQKNAVIFPIDNIAIGENIKINKQNVLAFLLEDNSFQIFSLKLNMIDDTLILIFESPISRENIGEVYDIGVKQILELCFPQTQQYKVQTTTKMSDKEVVSMQQYKFILNHVFNTSLEDIAAKYNEIYHQTNLPLLNLFFYKQSVGLPVSLTLTEKNEAGRAKIDMNLRKSDYFNSLLGTIPEGVDLNNFRSFIKLDNPAGYDKVNKNFNLIVTEDKKTKKIKRFVYAPTAAGVKMFGSGRKTSIAITQLTSWIESQIKKIN